MDFSKEIEKMQSNYLIIRRAGGWSTRDFGELIGVSNQTICNIENKKTILTKTQFLATLAALEFEISKKTCNEMLRPVLGIIFGDKELTDDERKKALSFIEKNKNVPQAEKKILSKELKTLIGVTSVAGITAGIISFLILKK